MGRREHLRTCCEGRAGCVKEIHKVDGKPMVRTIDDIYLSGASEHVKIEEL